jgi:hypothetical protein
MPLVDTTASITPVWTRSALEPGPLTTALWALRQGWRAWLVACLLALCALPALARQPEVLGSEVHRGADALELSVRLDLSAPPALQDALQKGVPMYFVWQADVFRDRWYWTDKRIASAVRTLRLTYQPLTRRWRLSQSNETGASAGAGLPYALHQNFSTLAEALAGVSRVSNWVIADAGRLEDGVSYRTEWRFRLDLTLLPRPLQIGVVDRAEWEIEVQGQLDVPDQVEPEPASPQ